MRLVAALALLIPAVACTTPAPLAPTYDSPEAVARAVLDGFAAGDADRLRRLALTETEFRQRVWPELPASRPERNLPFSYVWGDLKQKSDQSLAVLLKRHQGRRLLLDAVRFESTTPYQTFVVHRKTTMDVRENGSGPEGLRLLGSMIEQGGRWKVFSYVVDD
jgi:hypothetical protein